MIIAGNVGSDVRMSYSIIGDIVNVASRLEGVATPGQILVTQSTYRLTHGIFEFRPLEPIRVKGKNDPLAVFELIEAKSQRRHDAWSWRGLCRRSLDASGNAK